MSYDPYRVIPADEARRIFVQMVDRDWRADPHGLKLVRQSEVFAAIPPQIRRLPGFPKSVDVDRGRFWWRQQLVEFLAEIFISADDAARRATLFASSDAPSGEAPARTSAISEGEFLRQSPTFTGEILGIGELVRHRTPVEALQHSSPGVYFLWHRDRVVYVGQSRVGFARILSHLATKSFDAVSFVRCEPDQLLSLERAYINMLLPDLNADAETSQRRRARDATNDAYSGKPGKGRR